MKEKNDEWILAKMQQLKDEDEDAPSNYDKRYEECLVEISKECALYFKALVKRALYKANLHNLDKHTVFNEMVIPELQAKFEELLWVMN